MNSENLKQEWIEMSTPWIRETREGRNPSREGILDAPMLEACGDVSGLRVLDTGCGEGRFSRMLARRGAKHVLGIDLCAPMIEAARELPVEGVEYRMADAQYLDFVEDESFDLAVSYLNQCDLPDFARNNREVFRKLKRNGLFVIANLHPMRSAVGEWLKNEEGEKEHVILDHYLDEGERHWEILGVEITNFHRTLSTYVNDFLAAGFVLEGIVEPSVTPGKLEAYPELADELRVPNFIIYRLRKPVS